MTELFPVFLLFFWLKDKEHVPRHPYFFWYSELNHLADQLHAIWAHNQTLPGAPCFVGPALSSDEVKGEKQSNSGSASRKEQSASLTALADTRLLESHNDRASEGRSFGMVTAA